MELEEQLVGLDGCILVAGDDLESRLLDVGNGFRLGTIRIDLRTPPDAVRLEVCDDVLVLHMGLVAPLPAVEDFLPVVGKHLHPCGWIVREAEVKSLDFDEVAVLLREGIDLVEGVDETFQASLLSESVDLPPIRIRLVVLYLPYLHLGEEWVVLVGGLDEDAVVLGLNLLLYPTNGGRVVVNEDDSGCTHRHLPEK